MKKNLFAIMMLAMVAVSCEKNDDNDGISGNMRVLTFEDDSWSSLIDTKEYEGSLLYSTTTQYTWTDTNNTLLNGVVNEGTNWDSGETEYMFWNGGIAISNYYLDVVSDTKIPYTNQLSVSNGSAGAAGYKGSANFAIVNVAYTPTYLSFGDGTARTIDHLYISSTSYLESVALDGNDFSQKLGDDNYFYVTATGFDTNDNAKGSVTYQLADDGVMVSGWNKWDLSSLGDVAKVQFSIASDVANEDGMTLPTYFAIDDIAVVFE